MALPKETVGIETLNEFVELLAAWHDNRVAQVEHLMEIPEGTEVMLGDSTFVLEGDTHAAFVAGLTTALFHLGKLPFKYQTTEDDDPPEQVH